MAPEPRLERSVLAPGTAGFGARVLARILDGVVVGVPLAVVVWALGVEGWGLVLPIAVSAVYEIGLIARRGQTIGKRALGIAVESTRDGGLPSMGQAAMRWALPSFAGFAPGGFAMFAAAIVFLPMFADPWRRGLHDRAAATRVVTTGGR